MIPRDMYEGDPAHLLIRLVSMYSVTTILSSYNAQYLDGIPDVGTDRVMSSLDGHGLRGHESMAQANRILEGVLHRSLVAQLSPACPHCWSSSSLPPHRAGLHHRQNILALVAAMHSALNRLQTTFGFFTSCAFSLACIIAPPFDRALPCTDWLPECFH